MIMFNKALKPADPLEDIDEHLERQHQRPKHHNSQPDHITLDQGPLRIDKEHDGADLSTNTSEHEDLFVIVVEVDQPILLLIFSLVRCGSTVGTRLELEPVRAEVKYEAQHKCKAGDWIGI